MPIMSHNAPSHNLVLQLTLPRRTGRKRKRGSDGPWLPPASSHAAGACQSSEPPDSPRSLSRLDAPRLLRRKLADTAGRYRIQPIGIIKHTHRFRALADFYWDMSKSSFAQRFAHQVLPGDGMFLALLRLGLRPDLRSAHLVNL